MKFFLAVVVCGAALLALSVPSVAQEEEPSSLWWVSAGDSYSSGEGVLFNQPGVGRSGRDCAVSLDAWGPAAAVRLRDAGWQFDQILHTACSGALSQDYFNDFEFADGPADQLESDLETRWREGGQRALALEANPPNDRWDVITLSFGGNDIRFADTIVDCLSITTTDFEGTKTILGQVWRFGAGETPLLGRLGDECDSREETLRNSVDWLFDPNSQCDEDPNLGRRPTTVERGDGTLQNRSNLGCALVIDGPTARVGGLAEFWKEVVDRDLATGGRLVVMGYPRIFADSDEWSRVDAWGRCMGVQQSDAEMLGRVSKYLDEKFQERVEGLNKELRDRDDIDFDRVIYVSVQDSYGEGHGLCGDGEPWLNGSGGAYRGQSGDGVLDVQGRPEGLFHPNLAGHTAEAALVAEALADNPPTPRPPLADYTCTTAGTEDRWGQPSLVDHEIFVSQIASEEEWQAYFDEVARLREELGDDYGSDTVSTHHIVDRDNFYERAVVEYDVIARRCGIDHAYMLTNEWTGKTHRAFWGAVQSIEVELRREATQEELRQLDAPDCKEVDSEDCEDLRTIIAGALIVSDFDPSVDGFDDWLECAEEELFVSALAVDFWRNGRGNIARYYDEEGWPGEALSYLGTDHEFAARECGFPTNPK